MLRIVAAAVLAAGSWWATPSAADDPPAPPALPGQIPLGPAPAAAGLGEQWWGEGRSGLTVRNVTRAALVPVLPDPDTATGAGVIVLPGGALVLLSFGHEGLSVADALAARGVAAFVLKYRTHPAPREDEAFSAFARRTFADFAATGGLGPLPGEDAAQVDAAAGLALVRARAADFGVDPDRVGMLGFSAGAITALNLVVADGVDRQPAFAGLLYGPTVAVTPPADPPPLFVTLTADDSLFGHQGFGLVESWREAGGSAEIHAFARGGHGFGLARRGRATDLWLELFHNWLAEIGMVPPPPR